MVDVARTVSWSWSRRISRRNSLSVAGTHPPTGPDRRERPRVTFDHISRRDLQSQGDGEALRFQVRRPDGNLAEFSLRLTTSQEGGLNMRLDFCGAGSDEGHQLSGRGEVGPDYS